jgi:hypothetical protein
MSAAVSDGRSASDDRVAVTASRRALFEAKAVVTLSERSSSSIRISLMVSSTASSAILSSLRLLRSCENFSLAWRSSRSVADATNASNCSSVWPTAGSRLCWHSTHRAPSSTTGNCCYGYARSFENWRAASQSADHDSDPVPSRTPAGNVAARSRLPSSRFRKPSFLASNAAVKFVNTLICRKLISNRTHKQQTN